jgi:hypothetical protein
MEAPQETEIEITYDPLLGIYPQELKTGSQIGIWTSTFIAAFFTIAKR